MKANDLRKGLGVKIDGKLYYLTAVEHRTPGNLRAFVQVTAKEVLSGRQLERRLSSSDELEVVDLDNRPAEFLYADMDGGTFMDQETFDQVHISKAMLGDALLYLRPNSTVSILMNDGNPISVDLPAAVELTVKDCPPEVKGATVTNQTKDAEMETGLVVKVPAFIKPGESLKVSTADGSYLSRA
ncbi:MAG: elongation factor P [Phycisphaerales bacterium]|nr:elongation factor P [Phycisphaerales bacterium]